MNLLVDIGNTRVKFCYAKENDVLTQVENISHEESTKVFRILEKEVSQIIISTTASEELTERVVKILKESGTVQVFSHESNLPFTSKYSTPKTLGLDRIANVAGAFHHFPSETNLVIDIGTCITYDVLTKNGEYVGGAISPGVKMRLKSMNDYSARLPFIEKMEEVSPLGESTHESMLSGVFYGILGEIHQFIERTEQSFGDHNVLITGGDSFLFEEVIKYPIFANPKLTLQGLNEILKRNI